MNRKKGRNPIFKEFGTYDISAQDLKNLEKIVLKRIKPSDSWVGIGRPKGWFFEFDYEFDRVALIPKSKHAIRYLELKFKVPNVRITFKPHSTKLSVQRAYYKGEKLKQLDGIGREVEKYFSKLRAKGKQRNSGVFRRLYRNRIEIS